MYPLPLTTENSFNLDNISRVNYTHAIYAEKKIYIFFQNRNFYHSFYHTQPIAFVLHVRFVRIFQVKILQFLNRKNATVNNKFDSHSQGTTVFQLSSSVNARKKKMTLFSPAPLLPS